MADPATDPIAWIPPALAAVGRDFPLLERGPDGVPRVYLDNATTALTPRVVLDRIARQAVEAQANAHRGTPWLNQRAVAACEDARTTVRQFFNAAQTREIVFVAGTTEAIDLVARSYGSLQIGRDDEVVLSIMDHQANMAPWQSLCARNGAHIRIIPMSDAGELDLDAYEELLSDRTRIVAVPHVSNVLGTINPIADIVRLAHRRRIPVVVDGAQAVAHMTVDVQALGCDFYACSGRKMLGPEGIGVLYARSSLLERMAKSPSGSRLTGVTIADGLFDDLPARFESPTPPVADIVGLVAAIEYLHSIGFDAIAAYERELRRYATAMLSRISGIRLLGMARQKSGILSFLLDGVAPQDVAMALARERITIRAGDHRCQPLMQRLGVTATARASLAFYNRPGDIEALAAALVKMQASQ